MTTREVTDKSGNILKGIEIEGRLCGLFNPESLTNVTKVKARPDDVIILTHPKSGTHWLVEITRLLQAGTIDTPTINEHLYMLDCAKPSFIDSLPSPRNLNTHFHGDLISRDFISQKCKMIYMMRDPRDVIVSFYNHHKQRPQFLYQGNFDDYFQLFIEGKVNYGSWFQHVKSWEKVIRDNPDNPILVLTYESMKQNPLESVTKLSEFLGYNYNAVFLQDVVNKCSFESMHKEKCKTNQFAPYVYRKGITGDWKNWFTVAQSEMFNQVFEREMVGTQAYTLYTHK